MNDHRLNVICKACNEGHAIIGDCATECSACGASIDMDTGEPFIIDGKVIYTAQFGGKNFAYRGEK
jgi:hypothetical protein